MGASISTNCDQGDGCQGTAVKESDTYSTGTEKPVASNHADLLVPDDLQDDMCMNCPRLIPPGIQPICILFGCMLKCTQVRPGHLSVPSLNGQMQSGHHLCHDVVIVDAQMV